MVKPRVWAGAVVASSWRSMALQEYNRKRRFGRTPEPKGQVAKSRSGRLYVVQKHAATRLHYDFRLELDGVLKSWAVPKGPSLDPKQRRLAVQVEDHPVEYGSFEGVIPEGEYGGGTVVLWDQGAWEPLGDPDEDYRKGQLKFQLHGEKLRGGWMLVRMPRRAGEKSVNWLLIKERDDEARPDDEYDVIVERPDSVATGRSLEDVAAERDRVWTGNGEVKVAQRTNTKTPGKAKARATKAPRDADANNDAQLGPKQLKGAKKAPMPAWIEPQLATLSKQPPEGDRWLHEIKFDGYRIIAKVERGKAQLWSRNQLDWTVRFKPIADDLGKLPVEQALLDGEVVALDVHGVSSFQSLQNVLKERRAGGLVYQAFDLLYLDGYDLRQVVLEDRKRLLAQLIAEGKPGRRIQYTEDFEGDGGAFFHQVCRLGLEGIVSKNRSRPYFPGRSAEWLKTKCVAREEFVIGGFTEPSGSRRGLGALLVGYYDARGKLRYAGRVGTGFSEKLLGELRKRLDALERKTSPFDEFGPGRPPRGTHWVDPTLVAQVEFTQWTRDGILRNPSFQGLREDKPAREVRRDVAIEAANGDDPNSAANGKAKRRNAKSKSAKPTTTTRADKAEPNVADTESKGLVAGIQLTHPDKVLYPELGITKLGLAGYYLQAADWMLPYVAARPLTLVRCPAGQAGKCFFQKHVGPGLPANLRSVAIAEKDKVGQYVVVDDVAGLVSLVQMGALEIHMSAAREDDFERPDMLIFDLDPDPTVAWPEVIRAAREMRAFLEDLGLRSFVKTTGGKGLHVVAPVRRRHEWPALKQFAKDVAERVAGQAPDRYLTNMSKAARQGKIFIDYLRNERNATSVAPFSTRAKPTAPVSTPVDWDELTPTVTSDYFNVSNLPGRLAKLERDPWADFFKLRRSITAAMIKRVRG